MKNSKQQKPPFVCKKTLFIIVLYLFFCKNTMIAQSKEANNLSKNNVYFDLGILPGAQAFINYERRVHAGKNITWYGRVGMGYAGIDLDDIGSGGLGAITMLTRKRNSHFELNMGLFTGKGSTSNDIITSPLLDIGYRYQKPSGGLIFKSKIGILGIGVGLGYAF